jgi:chemotaxis signal transduction protein
MTLNGGESPAKRDLIIFKESVGPAFGILVDHTGDIINVPPESLESWAEGPGANSAGSFNSSICKNGDKLISVLAPERFLLN